MLNKGTDLCFNIDDEYFNTLILNVYWQRPSLFNFATPNYVYGNLNPCKGLEFPFRPYQSVEQPLPVPGTGGQVGLDFTLNIEPPRISFESSQFRLTGEATLGMPALDTATPVPPLTEYGPPYDGDRPIPPPHPAPADPAKPPNCWTFSFELIGVVRHGRNGESVLWLEAKSITIYGIDPPELRALIETYLMASLRYGLLPRLKVPVEAVTLHMGALMSLHVALAPTGPALQDNPELSQDALAAYFSVDAIP